MAKLHMLLAAALVSAVSAVTAPNCSIAVPAEKNLTSVKTALTKVPATPFGILYSQTETDVAFVALNHTLGVLNASSFPPALIHQVVLPLEYFVNYELGRRFYGSALGMALSDDGHNIFITTESTGLIVVDASKAAACSADAVVGFLNGTAAAGSADIEVTVSKDFAFVSQEYGSPVTDQQGTIEVFQIPTPGANGSISGPSVGYHAFDFAVVGSALSANQSLLHVTSEADRDTNPELNITLSNGERVIAWEGNLATVGVANLTANPSTAPLLSNVTAGCSAVRVVLHPTRRPSGWPPAKATTSLLTMLLPSRPTPTTL